MLKAVAFDMGGVIYTAVPDENKRIAFAADAIALLADRGVFVSDAPEVFAKKLSRSDRQRRSDNESSLREADPVSVWVDYHLVEYGATRAQLFPIAEELCFRWNRDRNDAAPRKGLADCVMGLYEQGMRLAIVSNTQSRTYVPYLLEQFGVSRYFELTLLSSVTGLRKPGAAAFRLCQDCMGLTAGEMAYVGDTISRDVIGVKNAGWAYMIRLDNPLAKESERVREAALEKSGFAPDATAAELAEIPGLIAAYNSCQ